ncbi:hypothetical protein ACHM2U_16155, partial [Clostridium perfringens]
MVPQTSYETSKGFGVALQFDYSNTPEENLVSSGPELDLFYEIEKASKNDSTKTKDKPFTSNLKVKGGVKDI